VSSSLIVAGVDVGGRAKGFHAVALKGGSYLDQFTSHRPSEIGAWCRRIDAQIVGVDAPCHWSLDGRARRAERELMAQRIWCFSTPRRETADAHSKDHFRWVLNGADLFQLLQSDYQLFDGRRWKPDERVCFETFPHAVACALANRVVSAKEKRRVRRAQLAILGIDLSRLTNIDLVDATLCAVTAQYLAQGNFQIYGDAATGFILTPTPAG